MATLHLIRHGQASFGAEDYDQLSPLGVRQSQLLGEWMQRCGERPTRVIVGPMLRHRQTAEACLSALQARESIAIEVHAGISEFDHVDVLARFHPELVDARAISEFLGRSSDPIGEFQKVFPAAMQRWWGDTVGEYVESWSAFKQRCVDALAGLTADPGEGDSTWVFTSGGPIAVIVQHLLGIADAHMLQFSGALANSGVTRVRYRHDAVGLGSFNGCAHLELHGDPSLVTYR